MDGAPTGSEYADRAMSAYERIPVKAPPEACLAGVREVLRSQSLVEYAVVDHGHDMAAAGTPGITAWTLVFGNPAAGARLLERNTAAAVDIPLRLAVVAAESGASEIVLRDMRSLLTDDLADFADAFTGALRSVAAQARDLAEAG